MRRSFLADFSKKECLFFPSLFFKGLDLIFRAIRISFRSVKIPIITLVSAETKAYQPIPMIADFTNENGSDSLRETIEANYRQVKQEVLSLVESETARIKADPTLSHLIKE